jgi:hypothetical protein
MDSKTVLKLIVGIVIVVILLRMLTCRGGGREMYAEYPNYGEYDQENYADYDPMEMENDQEPFVPNNTNKATPAPRMDVSPTMAPLAKSVDLLPKPVRGSTDFGEFAPKNLGTQNFVDATKFIGVDTQGSSLKNANYQLRPDPPIPRKDVGPFSNSTIEYDLMRKNVFC